MPMMDRTAADMLDRHIQGTLLSGSEGGAWQDVLVQIFSRRSQESSVLVPAVAEPLIVWILSGSADLEERELNGSWQSSQAQAGSFYLTASPTPYELRWRARGRDPFRVMHLYLGLPVLDRAVREVTGQPAATRRLRDVSGGQDSVLTMLLEQFRLELTAAKTPSKLFVQGLAQSLAVHLARHYLEDGVAPAKRRNALPAFKLRRVVEDMEARLGEAFDLGRSAKVAGMSTFHFSRLFKHATGQSPSQYFIRLRMARARQLLRETERSVIEIGLEVGYASPSHFAQIFRREVGVVPTAYRE